MRVPLSKSEMERLNRLYARNRYEGIARGYKLAGDDLANKIKVGKLV